ncbi:MAG: nucleotidyltransferase domain-containing protein [bacterium]|nr:nucleotidyltransferase domain-containing protein [bacterium]
MLTNKQIEQIVDEIKKDGRIQAILLCGSYVYGHPTEESDLDVRAVTMGSNNWQEWDRIRFGHKVELFCNPAEVILGYFEMGRRDSKPDALHFWTHGKIVYDPNGIAKQLQQEAGRLLNLGPYSGSWDKSEKYIV